MAIFGGKNYGKSPFYSWVNQRTKKLQFSIANCEKFPEATCHCISVHWKLHVYTIPCLNFMDWPPACYFHGDLHEGRDEQWKMVGYPLENSATVCYGINSTVTSLICRFPPKLWLSMSQTAGFPETSRDYKFMDYDKLYYISIIIYNIGGVPQMGVPQ